MSQDTAQTQSKKKKDALIDVPTLIAAMREKWWWFAISVVFFSALALVYNLRKEAVYEVDAAVIIEDENQGESQMAKLMAGTMFGGSSTVDDEQMIMSSHSVLRETVQELGLNCSYLLRQGLFDRRSLYNDQPVQLYYPEAMNDTLSVGIFFKVKVNEDQKVSVVAEVKKKTIAEVKNQDFPVTVETKYGVFTLNKTSFFAETELPFKELIWLSNYEAAAAGLAEDVDIYIPSKRANFINLSMKATNTDRGMAILNTIIANYNNKGIKGKQTKGIKTAQFIDSRLEMLSKELTDAEAGIEDYKKDNNITDVNAEARYLLTQKAELEAKLIAAETEFEILKLTRDFIANPDNRYELIPVPSMGSTDSFTAPAVINLINSYNGLILQRMKIENNAKKGNASLAVIESQLDAMRGNIDTTLNKNLENASITLRELRTQTNRSIARLGDIPTQEREFRAIKRQQTVKEQLYLFLLQERERTALSIANAIARGTVVDEAYVQVEPLGMSNKKAVALGFIFGLLVPLGIILLQRLLRTKFRTREEVEARIDGPMLGEISQSSSTSRFVVTDSSSVAELFRLVRANLQFMMRRSNDKVILITSTKSGEGKSFVSVNMAGSFAMTGKKVVLIGMDIRKPQLANYLGVSPEPGLTQYLSSDRYSLNDIIRRDAICPGLDLIVAGPIPPNPGELLGSPKVEELINTLREHYDYIVIDSAPVGMVSDTLLLDRIADVTVYVTRANYTTFQDLEFANEFYNTKRLNNMAFVVNGTQAKKGYGYGYGNDHKK